MFAKNGFGMLMFVCALITILPMILLTLRQFRRQRAWVRHHSEDARLMRLAMQSGPERPDSAYWLYQNL